MVARYATHTFVSDPLLVAIRNDEPCDLGVLEQAIRYRRRVRDKLNDEIAWLETARRRVCDELQVPYVQVHE